MKAGPQAIDDFKPISFRLSPHSTPSETTVYQHNNNMTISEKMGIRKTIKQTFRKLHPDSSHKMRSSTTAPSIQDSQITIPAPVPTTTTTTASPARDQNISTNQRTISEKSPVSRTDSVTTPSTSRPVPKQESSSYQRTKASQVKYVFPTDMKFETMSPEEFKDYADEKISEFGHKFFHTREISTSRARTFVMTGPFPESSSPRFLYRQGYVEAHSEGRLKGTPATSPTAPSQFDNVARRCADMCVAPKDTLNAARTKRILQHEKNILYEKDERNKREFEREIAAMQRRELGEEWNGKVEEHLQKLEKWLRERRERIRGEDEDEGGLRRVKDAEEAQWEDVEVTLDAE